MTDPDHPAGCAAARSAGPAPPSGAGAVDLGARAELTKLARALGTPPERVEFLAGLPVEDLRVLRDRVSAALFDRHRAGFQRMAAASRLLPMGVLAAIATRTMPPLLAARIAAEMPPERAAELATKLDTPYLADVCVELDPRRAGPVVAALPLPVVVAVATELVRRTEHLTIGRFVDAASDDVVHAVLGAVTDESLLRIASHVETADQLTRVVTVLGSIAGDRLRRIVLAAVTGPTDLQLAGLSLLSRATGPIATHLADLAAEAPTSDLTRLRLTATTHNALPALESVLTTMSPTTRARVAHLAAPPH